MFRLLFSTRFVVLVTSILSLVVAIVGIDRVLGPDIQFSWVLIGILCFTALAISFSAFASFDIPSKRAFVVDIVMDMIFLAGAIVVLTYLITLHLNIRQGVEAEAIVLSATAVALATLDFLVSLNGGAGKLLEMDREHFTRDN